MATSKKRSVDTSLAFIAASFSGLNEYLINSTVRINKAATSAMKMIVQHALAKLPQPHAVSDGYKKVLMNLNYLLSSRFQEQSSTASSF